MGWRSPLKYSAAFAVLFWASNAQAQERLFNLSSEDAARALPEFARQAGIQILAPAANLRGVVLPPIMGSYDVRDALRLLLANTDLEIATDDGEIITLRIVKRTKTTEAQKKPATILRTPRPQNAQIFTLLDSAQITEVIVTGSRIVRDGYEAPTPVTVVGLEQIQEAAKPNIADVLNQMPVFQNSVTPRASGAQNEGRAGGNNLNLRNLDANRTLILFDGRRYPAEFITGLVDINLLPDALISRIDVVTGGASAVYGSDAVAGVVNFVLDTNFVGVRGLVEGGVTAHGDGRNYKVALAAGTHFANDRGHLLLQADSSYQARIDGDARAWNLQGYYNVQNPSYAPGNGQPQLLSRYEVGLTAGYSGGIIAGGPLKGIAFGPGGAPFMYNYGSLVAGSYNIGGDWRSSSEMGGQSLIVGSNSTHLFSYSSYDIADDVQVYAQFNNGDVKTNSRCCYVYYLGNLTVHPDNPFMPASVANQAIALGQYDIPFGTTLRVNPRGFGSVFDRLNDVYVLGFKGKTDALGAEWSWNAYAQRGISKQDFWVPYQSNTDKFLQAIDAVRGPDGQVVCRSTLLNSNDGCVPYNVFGIGVVSQNAFDYTQDGPRLSQTISQDVVGVSATAEPMVTWAGPISIALSGEYRRDAVRGINDPYSPSRGWFSTQMNGFDASLHVVEGALEAVVPLAQDEKWAKALDLNAAVRATDYSASGYVTTWKIGATYQPTDDVRLRTNLSRDIRAPNLSDLFSSPQTNHDTIADPFRGNASYPVYTTALGNPALSPEKASTTGIGVVYKSSWIGNFTASVDYYRIDIKGAIALPTFAYVLNQCYAGVASYCADVTRLPNGDLNVVYARPHNQNRLLANGVDYEASYQTALSDIHSSWNGTMGLRIVATNTIDLITDTGIAGPTQILDAAGTGSSPKWSVNASIAYSLDPIRITWTGHYISPTRISNLLIQCSASCSDVPGLRTIESNSVRSYFLQNLSINYRLYQNGENYAEAFLNVENLFDRDPPLSPQIIAGATYQVAANANLYDTLGRQFRVGIRFKM